MLASQILSQNLWESQKQLQENLNWKGLQETFSFTSCTKDQTRVLKKVFKPWQAKNKCGDSRNCSYKPAKGNLFHCPHFEKVFSYIQAQLFLFPLTSIVCHPPTSVKSLTLFLLMTSSLVSRGICQVSTAILQFKCSSPFSQCSHTILIRKNVIKKICV